jgi:farnesyl-diphosphate farnesyltransferase
MISLQGYRLLKNVARSFYLSIRLLPPTLRGPVALAYLLARASDTIVDEEKKSMTVSEQELMRLLPSLIEELKDPQQDRFDADAIQIVWQKILEGQAFDLEKFSSQNQLAALERFKNYCSRCSARKEEHSPAVYSDTRGREHRSDAAMRGYRNFENALTPDELDRYLYLVAGCVGEFWTKLAAHHLPGFSKEPLERMMTWGIHYGKGLQLVNILRDRQEDERRGRFYCTEDQVSQLHLQASVYLKEGEAYVKALQPGRLKVATALPLLLGQQTLILIKKRPNAEGVKISRWKVYGALLQALRFLVW